MARLTQKTGYGSPRFHRSLATSGTIADASAGRLDGIDLLIDRSYAKLYGSNYQDAVAPPSVSEAEDEVVALVA